MAKRKEEADRKNHTMAILVTGDFKREFTAFCEKRGQTPSQHIRALMDEDFAYFASTGRSLVD